MPYTYRENQLVDSGLIPSQLCHDHQQLSAMLQRTQCGKSRDANQEQAQFQAPKTAWQTHSNQGLVENQTACQALKTAWQVHSIQGVIKVIPKCQVLQTAWQAHSIQGLIKLIAKCQALKT